MMLRRSFLIVFALIVLQREDSVAQTDTLATVFGVPITAGEFVQRWELAVYPGKDKRSTLDSTKIRFLYSLIAEKLLARAPLSPGAAADSGLERLRLETEETFMRDALFRREVMNKVVIQQKDLEEAVRFSAFDYAIDVFRCADSVQALRFVKKSRGLDSARVYAMAEAQGIGFETMTVSFGDLQESVERSFFGKLPGFMSQPVRSKRVYAVIRIVSRAPNKKYPPMALPDRLFSLKRKILERRMDADGWRYLVEVMRTIRVEVDPEQFYPLAGQIQTVMMTHELLNRGGEGYYLTQSAFDDLKTNLKDRLEHTLVRFPDTTMTVREAIAALPTANFAPKDTTAKAVQASLHAALRFCAQNYYLVKRAEELGLRDAPEVQSDVQMFVDAARAADVAETIRAGVHFTTAERDSFFAIHRDEILSDIHLLVRFGTVKTVQGATEWLQRLQAAGTGEGTPPFDTSAIHKRWVYGSEVGEIGAALARLSPGSVYGPISGPRGYTVFQLLAKETLVADSSLVQSIEAAERKLLEQKRIVALDQYIGTRAGEADVRIFRSNVASTAVLPSQMYTMRYIGFGGRVNAVPSLTPRETWVRFSGRNLTILP